MMQPKQKKNLKFGAGMGVILMTLAWLAYSGIQESKTYYITVDELQEMSDAYDRRYRVAGNVAVGSIRRSERRVEFQLEQNGKLLQVVYTGTEPLPDTLQDRAEAIAHGRYQRDGIFHAETVQAKCASKYEAAPMAAGAGEEAGSAY
ncbi:MAG: cytochrome c maturation protein CcmE [Acidobacteria bacterium]|nr:cytochrome c maturation protein CcmE [Acidobacteriota bacterium]MCZ6753530.1 cytochrome c maturation protein CcmE [Acidobacteriota bacterium]